MSIMAGPNYRDVDDELEAWLEMQEGRKRQDAPKPPFARTLLIHKADNGPRAIFNSLDDVTINITELAGEPAYQAEGIGLAEALYGTLPAVTVAALLKRLEELSEGKGEEA